MFERIKQSGYLQVDETQVKVMDPEVKGKCARGYLWFYAVPNGDVYLDFQGTRGRAAPQAQLTGFTGTIQADAYEVYDSLKKVIPNLRRIGWAAPCRRKFRRALRDGDRRAIPFIAHFRRLYRIEAQTKNLMPQERHQIRDRGIRKRTKDVVQSRLISPSTNEKADHCSGFTTRCTYSRFAFLPAEKLSNPTTLLV